MKQNLIIFLFGIFSVFTGFAQQTEVRGSVTEATSYDPIPEVTISIEGTALTTQTNALGEFSLSSDVPFGEQILVISKSGYASKRYPIVVNEGKTLTIDDMVMERDLSANELFTIQLSDDELNDDDAGTDNISGLLSSSLDVFQRTAAFEFSSSFFRVRGLDSDNGTVLINGIEMNKFDTGRPQWGNWGGLNDVVRNQELSFGLAPSDYTFGGVLGTTNINTKASTYREGGRVTYSSSNRSYSNRLMASYASGLLQGGWSYVIMAGRRWGDEGYQDATLYDSNSFFASVEKQIGDKHSLNFTSIYAPNRRGKSSANTQEVTDLKGIKYNEYWGYLDGKKRNSRIKEVEEPILMLNHTFDISSKTSLNTNIGYQFGKIGNSRIDNASGANPSPAYYQHLPSYYLADDDGPDFAGAYGAEQEFLNDGQLNWNNLFIANDSRNTAGKTAAYTLYEDRVDDKTLTLNTIFRTEIKDNIVVNASVNYRKLTSDNFAEVIDLLGSNVGGSNVDAFSQKQFNMLNPDQIIQEGDKFRYNYRIEANEISGFAQAQFKYNKIDFHLGASITKTDYQREGLFKNGNQVLINTISGEELIDNSSGKGDKLDFTGIGAKGGFTYKVTGKHLINVNAAYLTEAPTLRNTYTNSREAQDYVGNFFGNKIEGIDLTEEKITSADVSYIFRSPIVKARLTGFYTKIEDANEISFFFTQGSSTGFIQETLANTDKKHIGAELGIEAQVTPTIKLKAAASMGQYTYDNNPFVYFTSTSEDFIGVIESDEEAENGNQEVRSGQVYKAFLKDYKVAGGPQGAYSVGFEYRDPDYWWFGATANYFTNTYVDISPLARSERFYQDFDGIPYSDYDPELSRELLRQKRYDDYLVINLVGGKSWKINNNFIGFFASVGNILDKVYNTGGYEQGRTADYRAISEDASNPKQIFGSKNFFGRGANYFVNVYYRF